VGCAAGGGQTHLCYLNPRDTMGTGQTARLLTNGPLARGTVTMDSYAFGRTMAAAWAAFSLVATAGLAAPRCL